MGFTKSFGRLGATMDCSLSATISWERARWSYYTCDKKDAKVPGFSGFSPGFVGEDTPKKGKRSSQGSPGNGRRCWVGKGWFGVPGKVVKVERLIFKTNWRFKHVFLLCFETSTDEMTGVSIFTCPTTTTILFRHLSSTPTSVPTAKGPKPRWSCERHHGRRGPQCTPCLSSTPAARLRPAAIRTCAERS